MEVIKTQFDGLLVFQPKIFRDERGYFFEYFRKDVFKDLNVNLEFVQSNESQSNKNVLRGMHFQNPPHEQGKLIRVVKGTVLDVSVDIRLNSATYGKWFSRELNETNKTILWIPAGFAHGFLTLADNTIFQYECTNYYHRESEGSIRWNDPQINIDWKVSDPVISDKDKSAPLFSDFQSKFK
jgi:dTDP-4-dehydrorhamnose 3,5-epimerase